MPGRVIAKHAHVETKCDSCHVSFDKSAQNGLCLACHEDVRDDLASKRGHHGLDPAVRDAQCQSCHAEHEGRDAAAFRLDPESFDHRQTDYALRGSHRAVACAGCHLPGNRHRNAPQDCADCHAGDDPHQGSLTTDCGACHEEAAWITVRWTHDASRFALEGKHTDAACTACHASRIFKPTATDCRSCHAAQDAHDGRLGGECRSCHTPARWKGTTFDHSRRAKFPLLGRHGGVKCVSCHVTGTQPGQTPTTCRGCHQRDDAHGGRFGATCESCHTSKDWRSHTFDHTKSAHYPLRGRHAEIRCVSCHPRALQAERPARQCYSCHRGHDVHRGREGTDCERCHDETGWSRGVLFDHDATTFRLTGAHAHAPCKGCHLSPDFGRVERECASCHAREDVHRGKEGTRCERCHETSKFSVVRTPLPR